MSSCSDVYMTKKEATRRVKARLLDNHEQLLEIAVNSMTTSELTSYLNIDGSDFYYYNITEED